MKQIIPFLTLLLLSSLVQGQITIDSSDIGIVGDQMNIVVDAGVVGKSANAPLAISQVFDYSDLSYHLSHEVHFLDPSSTVAASLFPLSNMVISVDGELVYAKKSDSSLVMDGVYGDPFEVGSVSAMNFDPDAMILPFPLQFGANFNSLVVVDTVILDTISGGLFDSLRVKRISSTLSVVDAFGTLMLPNSQQEVLRIYDYEVTKDTVWGQISNNWVMVQELSNTQDKYRFIAKNNGYFILETMVGPTGDVLEASFQNGLGIVSGIINNNAASCFGAADGSLEVQSTGGLAPYSYVWSSGHTTQVVSGLTAGIYDVVTTDALGDKDTTYAEILQPDSLNILPTQIGADHGFNDGFVHIIVGGGVPGYSYSWSNGETTRNIDNLSFGTYTVTVTDASGCDRSKSYIVDDITSVNELPTEMVSIYPNPTKGIINIETTIAWELKIITLSGDVLFETNGEGSQIISLSNIASGFYIMQLKMDEVNYTSRLQVIK